MLWPMTALADMSASEQGGRLRRLRATSMRPSARTRRRPCGSDAPAFSAQPFAQDRRSSTGTVSGHRQRAARRAHGGRTTYVPALRVGADAVRRGVWRRRCASGSSNTTAHQRVLRHGAQRHVPVLYRCSRPRALQRLYTASTRTRARVQRRTRRDGACACIHWTTRTAPGAWAAEVAAGSMGGQHVCRRAACVDGGCTYRARRCGCPVFRAFGCHAEGRSRRGMERRTGVLDAGVSANGQAVETQRARRTPYVCAWKNRRRRRSGKACAHVDERRW